MALLFAVAFALALTSGAFESAFAEYDDEPSHLVTGLMLHDFANSWLQGAPVAPMAFAADYYVHYPKVALGQWPPVFPALQAVWYLAFGTSATAPLILMATLAGLLATVVFAAVRTDLGPRWALLAAVTLLVLPLVQRLSHAVMTEIPLTLFCTLAVLSFGRFVDTGRARSALAFAVFAVLAILTKGTGVFLVLVPPLTIAFTGRYELLRRPALWLAGATVIALCGPWFALTLDITQSTWSGGTSPTADYAAFALRFYGRELLGLGGVVMAAIALLGMTVRLRDRGGRWASLIAWACALLIGLLAVPTGGEGRHLIATAPVWVAAWAAGAQWLGARRPQRRWLPAAVAGLAALAFTAESLSWPTKHHTGFAAAAHEIGADSRLARAAVLIASDPKGEGAFISEMALLDRRPQHVVLRGSKMLATSDWTGNHYTPRFAEPSALADMLRDLPVAAVVIDTSLEPRHRRPHHALLQQVMRAQPQRWRRVAQLDVRRGDQRFVGALSVYFAADGLGRPAPHIRLDDVLGRKIPGLPQDEAPAATPRR